MDNQTDKNWISIKKVGLPELEPIIEDEIFCMCKSKDVLVQTERGEMHVAFFKKVYFHNEKECFTCWYSNNGKIISEIIAWMELPERYEGE